MLLQLYNTLKHNIDTFKTNKEKKVGLYTCGPTVYNSAHIGNLRSYIFADLLKRTLEAQGYDVTWVMNITDIDDKTIKNTIAEKGSQATVEDLKKTTEVYYQAFLEDLKEVGVDPNSIKFQKVTDPEVIQEIQTFIVKLIDKGYAYTADDGSTYFNIKKYQQDFGDYGELVGKKFLQGKKIGARISSDEYSKDELSDFALWKTHDKDDAQIFWDHPTLGKGRPGWHIECTVINYLNFPNGTDIHTGGVDLIFPHHTNEIAQAQPLYKPFVTHWMHSEHVMVDNKKMAKSAGNFITLKTIKEEKISPLAYRYLLLQTHYRKQLNFTLEALRAAHTGFDGLNKLYELYEETTTQPEDLKNPEFTPAAMDNRFYKHCFEEDLNFSEALSLVWLALKKKIIPKDQILKYDKILGLRVEQGTIPTNIQQLIEQRNQAREQKKWKESDKLRKEIENLGYEVEDTKTGTKLHKKL